MLFGTIDVFARARLVGFVERLEVGELLVDRSDVVFDNVGKFGDFDRSIVE